MYQEFLVAEIFLICLFSLLQEREGEREGEREREFRAVAKLSWLALALQILLLGQLISLDFMSWST